MATIRQRPETYAIAILTFQRHRHFQRTVNAERFISTLLRYRDQGQFQLHAFVVMPDHVHVLITPAMNVSTAKAIQFIKGGYTHAAGEDGEIWHSGYHEHCIRDLEDFEAQRQYIANNPERKRFEEYPHVHTRMAEKIDPAPAHLAEW